MKDDDEHDPDALVLPGDVKPTSEAKRKKTNAPRRRTRRKIEREAGE